MSGWSPPSDGPTPGHEHGGWGPPPGSAPEPAPAPAPQAPPEPPRPYAPPSGGAPHPNAQPTPPPGPHGAAPNPPRAYAPPAAPAYAPPGPGGAPAAPGAVPGWGPAPAAPGMAPGTAPAVPAKKKPVGLLIGGIGGGVTAFLAVIVILIVVLTQPDSHSLNTPSSAAGFVRDGQAEQTVNTERLKRSLRDQAQGKVRKVVSAVYSTAPGSLGATKVLFVGAEAGSLDPQSFLKDFTSSAQQVQSVGNPGGLSGNAACGQVSDSTGHDTAACVWADNDTFGQFLLLSDSASVPQAVGFMQRLRPKLEKKN